MLYNHIGKWYNHGHLPLFFREFMENMETPQNNYRSIKADIPLPHAVHILSKLFAQNGASLFAVGGAVRDYLYAMHHGGKYTPKDVDLATEVPPNKVIAILSSPAAISKGIKTFPKGEAFGVISAVVDGDEYEIATFREDGNYSDGRRPDSVSFSTPEKDAQRRDLTFNALFYDIDSKEIRDYNLNDQGEGQGLHDIKNLVARPVGNARDRFQEDKLRIPRLIRFFSRFNPGEIMRHLDQNTLAAIDEFKNLAGVSPERISAEFVAGLQKSAHPVNYIKNYQATGLIPAVFPRLNVNLDQVEKIGNVKNIKAVLAWLLRNEEPSTARSQLNRLKYSNEVADSVSFLLKLFKFNVNQIVNLLKYRDLYKQLEPSLQEESKKALFQDVQDFAKIAGLEAELNHFLGYQPTAFAKDFMHLQGKEIGDAMNRAETGSYLKSKVPNAPVA